MNSVSQRRLKNTNRIAKEYFIQQQGGSSLVNVSKFFKYDKFSAPKIPIHRKKGSTDIPKELNTDLLKKNLPAFKAKHRYHQKMKLQHLNTINDKRNNKNEGNMFFVGVKDDDDEDKHTEDGDEEGEKEDNKDGEDGEEEAEEKAEEKETNQS